MEDAFTKRLYGDTKFADLTLVCQGRRFKVHRVVMCESSEWISRSSNNAAKDQDTRIILIRGCDARTLHRVIEFAYLKDYQDDDRDFTLPPVYEAPPNTPRTSNVWDLFELSGQDSPTVIKRERSNSPTPSTTTKPSQGALVAVEDAENLGNIFAVTGSDIIVLDDMFAGRKKAALIAKAWIHLKVYDAAIKFEVEPLAETSISRLETQIVNSWTNEGFVDFLQVTFALSRQQTKATPACNLLAVECSKHIEALLQNKQFDDELRDNSHLGYLIIHALVNMATQRKTASPHKPIVKLPPSSPAVSQQDKLGSTTPAQPLGVTKPTLRTTTPSQPVQSSGGAEIAVPSTPSDSAPFLSFGVPKSSTFDFSTPNGFGKLQESYASSIRDAQNATTTAATTEAGQPGGSAKRVKGPGGHGKTAISQTADNHQSAHVQDLEVALRSAMQEIDQLKGRTPANDDHASRHGELQDALDSANKEIDKLQRRNRDLKFRAPPASVANNDELDGLKTELADAESLIGELRAQLSSKAESAKPLADSRVAELQAKIRDLLADMKTLKKEPESLKKELVALRADQQKGKQLQASLNLAQSRIIQLKSMETKVSSLKASNVDVKANCEKLKKQIGELQSDNSRKTTQIETLQSENRSLQTTSDKKSQEIQVLQDEHRIGRSEGSKKSKEIQKLQADNRSLQIRLNQAQTGGTAPLQIMGSAASANTSDDRNQLQLLKNQMETLKRQSEQEIRMWQADYKKLKAELETAQRLPQGNNEALLTENKDLVQAMSNERAKHREQVKALEQNNKELEQLVATHGPASTGASPAEVANGTSKPRQEEMAPSGVPERQRQPPYAYSASGSSTDNSTSTAIPPPTQGPLTFLQKMQLKRQAESAQAQSTVSTGSSPAPTAEAPAATPPATSTTSTTGGPTEHVPSPSRRPVIPLGGSSGRDREIEEGRRIMQRHLAEKDKQLGEKDRRIDFLQSQLTSLRLSPVAPPTGPRAGFSHSMHGGSNGEQRVRNFYNEALKVAGQDFKACVGCGAAFYAQFRGAPEDGGNILILKCTKCDEEVFRWKM
ncbi:BTB/POZ domain-containing protein 12 [Elsinoe australis]|uniref:BTB/POZ domain-containing protein 12 n=1 Tax=Elsinoe australis TaxID=40998 RepID=A0A4U7BEF9_9PEZI|nr:BTB/POZ domain-containing protein 12 [Elsinoe australis]